MRSPVQRRKPPEPELAGPFPPDLHDVRHLWLKAGLLAVWVLASFGATYFARDLQQIVLGDWPLGYWMAAQGAVLVFISIVVVYAWAMSRFERQDAAAQAQRLAEAASASASAGAPSLSSASAASASGSSSATSATSAPLGAERHRA
jgi:putative solute:sodium symporter small subunit